MMVLSRSVLIRSNEPMLLNLANYLTRTYQFLNRGVAYNYDMIWPAKYRSRICLWAGEYPTEILGRQNTLVKDRPLARYTYLYFARTTIIIDGERGSPPLKVQSLAVPYPRVCQLAWRGKESLLPGSPRAVILFASAFTTDEEGDSYRFRCTRGGKTKESEDGWCSRFSG